jgi:hypothetical protein
MSLAEKKQALQIKLRVAEESKKFKDWWLPNFLPLQKANIHYEIEYFQCVESPFYERWLIEVEENWQPYGITAENIKNRKDHYIHDQTFQRYTNTNPLRYVPDIPKLDMYDESATTVLNKLLANIPEQKFYFFFTRYEPVLILDRSSLLTGTINECTPDYEDVCFISTDLSLFIYKTLENDWYSNMSITQ